VKLDSGGVAKGLMADIAGGLFASHSGWAVDCAGDIRIGGAARRVAVDDPFGRGLLDEFEIADGAIATSGIGKRSWMNADGRPAHHLLDPSTGLPAYSGIVQATALAPTALEAEVLAKAALLSGPERAPGWLRHGGLIVLDDASHVRVPEAVFSGTSQPGLKVPLAPAPSLAS
jgi:thiamine biosynthesis lipoprotein